MTFFRWKFIVPVIVALHLVLFTDAQDLTAVECQARLPTGRYLLSTLYDEDDTIYVMGGYNNAYFRDVFKYSISRDTIERAGSLPENSYGGSTIMDENKNIFHFGTASSSNIYQYFPGTKNFNRIYMFGGIKDSGSIISQPEIWYISLNPIRPPTPTLTSTTTTSTPIPTTEEPTTEAPSTTKEPTTEAPPTTEEPTTEAPPESTTISTTKHSGSTTTPRPPHLCPVDDPMEPPNDQCDPDEPFPTYLSYPYDCTKFFQCTNGMAICQRCSNGTLWSQEDKVCVRNGVIPCDPPTTTPRSIVVSEYSIINFIKKYFF